MGTWGSARHFGRIALLLTTACGGKVESTSPDAGAVLVGALPPTGGTSSTDRESTPRAPQAMDGVGGSPPSLSGSGGDAPDVSPSAGGAPPIDRPSPAGGAPPGSLSIEAVELEGRAFELLPMSESLSSCAGGCQPLTIFFEAVDDESMTVLWGSKGRAERVSFVWQGTHWVLEGRPTLGREWPPAPSAMSYYSEASLEFSRTEDGAIELLLVGRAVTNWDRGGTSFSLTFLGRRDARPPAIAPLEDPVSVVSPFWFPLTKPLLSSATGRLVFSAGGSIELRPTVEEGFIVGFGTSVVLPYASSFGIEVTGGDSSGIGAPAPARLSTEPSFGTLPDGEFSFGATDGISGGSIAQAPAGSSSDAVLVVAAGETVVLRLPASPLAREVRFEARIVTDCDVATNYQTVAVLPLIIGQRHGLVEPSSLRFRSVAEEAVMGGQAVRLESVAQELSLPLGAAATGDVLLIASGSGQTMFGCFRAGALLDHVRLE